MKYQVYIFLLGALNKIAIITVLLAIIEKPYIDNIKKVKTLDDRKDMEDQSCKKFKS